MKFPLLSNSLTELDSSYDVVVVGSGYGGSIAAEKFAKNGLHIAILERGKEWRPGQFPRSLAQVGLNSRVENKNFQFGPTEGLFNWNQNKNLSVLRGIGLGGGSLINAAVAVRPEDNFLNEVGWPEGIKSFRAEIFKSFDRIDSALNVTTLPTDKKHPNKTSIFKDACAEFGSEFKLAPLAITFSSTETQNTRPACTHCGECMSGCNEGAKNSLDQNLLKNAKQFGAQIFTEISVNYLQRHPDGTWLVHVDQSSRLKTHPRVIRARHVVLAAGALGSTEILLRSKKKGLSLSNQLGHRFSGNNCSFGSVSYLNTPAKISAQKKMTPENAPGPCITAYTKISDPSHPFIVEDGSLPSFLPHLMSMGPFLMTLEKKPILEGLKSKDYWKQFLSDLQTMATKGQQGTINDSMIFLMAGKDSASGQMELNSQGQINISWENGVNEKSLHAQMNFIRKLAHKWNGVYSNQALWKDNGTKHKVSVHPLGGCRMADSADDGVVNYRGQVFNGDDNDVYPNLFVWDSSIIPVSLGINPFMTIAALSDVLSDIALPAMRLETPPRLTLKNITDMAPPTQPQHGFREVMSGAYYLAATREQVPLTLNLELTRMLVPHMDGDDGFQFKVRGSVATFTHGQSLHRALSGTAHILAFDKDRDTLTMQYNLSWSDENDSLFYLEGTKTVAKNILGLWPSTTTMPFSLSHTDQLAPRAHYAKGVVHINIRNVLEMISSMFFDNGIYKKNISNLVFLKDFGSRLWRHL